MEGVNNFAACLKILEDQGLQAEHRLLVQLFGCIETYWNTLMVKNLAIPKDFPNTSFIEDTKYIPNASFIEDSNYIKTNFMEEGEIELLEDEQFFPNQDLEDNVIQVKSEEVSTKKKKKIKEVEEETSFNSGERLNDEMVQSPSLDDLFSLVVEKEKTLKKKDFKIQANPEVTSGLCRYCAFKLPVKDKGSKYFRSQIRKHNKTEHFVCEICQKKHEDKDELDAHMDTLHKDMEGMVICGVNGCKRKMQKLQTTLAHVRLYHERALAVKRKKKDAQLKRKGNRGIYRRNSMLNPEVTSSQCKYCPFKIPGRQYFKTHLRKHNKTVHFVCEICRKKHDSKDELDVHMNGLHEESEGMVICGVNGCERKFRRLELVLTHIRIYHDRVADRICKDCNKPYLRLESHKRQHHVDPSSLKTCTACGYTCVTNHSLLVHTKLRHPKPGKSSQKFRCASCDFETNGLSQEEEYKLIMHKRIHQGGEIICTMCPYKTEKPYSLKRHLAEDHNIGFFFQCNQCNYKNGGPAAKGHMKVHMARHSNEKNFQCDQCEFAGITNESLKKHLQRHNPDASKYLCNECDYKSTDSCNFKAHKEVKHGSVVLSCEECDYNTKSRRSLREHKRKHLISLTSLTYQTSSQM